MLELGCTAAVRCRNGPSVFPRKPLWFAFCQNRFNGEGGAFLHLSIVAVAAMEDLWNSMKKLSDSMANQGLDNAEAFAFSNVCYCIADGFQRGSRTTNGHSGIQRLSR